MPKKGICGRGYNFHARPIICWYQFVKVRWCRWYHVLIFSNCFGEVNSIVKQKHEISSWQRDFMFLFGGKFESPKKTGTFDPFEAGEDEFTWFDGELFLLVSCEAPLSPFSTWDPEKISTEQWQRMARGCLGFLVGDEQPTQFFGDYFINQFWRVPIFNNQYFMESSKDFVHYSTTSWFHLGDCDPGAVTPSHIEAYT